MIRYFLISYILNSYIFLKQSLWFLLESHVIIIIKVVPKISTDRTNYQN